MNLTKSFLLLLISTILLSASKGISQKKTAIRDILLIAWNENTNNSYELVLTKNYKFYYTISLTDSIKTTSYFSGKYQIDSNKILLKYKENIQPKNATNYLTKEIQGRYLIQNFTTNQKRILMRIQRLFRFEYAW